MNRTTTVALALVACACGSEDGNTTRHVQVWEGSSNGQESRLVDEYDETVPAEDADGAADGTDGLSPEDRAEVEEYGQLIQAATTVPYLFGHSHPNNQVCSFPNDRNTPCIVPTDKIVKYAWSNSSPKTDPALLGVDFKERLQATITALQSLNTGWTVQYGNPSTTNELMSIGGTQGGLGLTTFQYHTPAESCRTGPVGQECFSKFNRCTTTVDPGVMQYFWGSLSLAQIKAKVLRLMLHEIGHCMGFTDFNWRGSEVYLMHGDDASMIPTTFTADELNALQSYRP